METLSTPRQEPVKQSSKRSLFLIVLLAFYALSLLALLTAQPSPLSEMLQVASP